MSSLTQSARDDLVIEHLMVVHAVLRSLSRTLPSHIDREELRSAGYTGLVCAASAFDPTRGVAFASYAARRVRGAMLDELRSQDWATRSVRAADRNRARTAEALAGQLRREASRAEIAQDMGTTVAALRNVEVEARRATFVSLNAMVEGLDPADDDAPCPLDTLIEREQHAYLRDAVSALPARLRDVVVAIYFQERSPREVALELGVSAARVSQLGREAMALLKCGIEAWSADTPKQQVETGSVVERRRAAYCIAAGHRSNWRARLTADNTARWPIAS